MYDQRSVHNILVVPNVIPNKLYVEVRSDINNLAPNINDSLKPARLPEIPLPTFHCDL